MNQESNHHPKINSLPKGLISDFEKFRDNFKYIIENGIEDFFPNSKFSESGGAYAKFVTDNSLNREERLLLLLSMAQFLDPDLLQQLLTEKNGAGNRIHLTDIFGIKHSFFHLLDGSITVNTGDVVKKGQIIAKIGTTGHSTGAHLHYEMHDQNGNRLNPRDANPTLSNAPTRSK
jgi:hypothetical protein